MCLTCCGLKHVYDICVCDEKPAPIRVLVDGNEVVQGDIEVVRLTYDADHCFHRTEYFVFGIPGVCEFLSVIPVLLVAPCYDDIVEQDAGVPLERQVFSHFCQGKRSPCTERLGLCQSASVAWLFLMGWNVV